MAINKVDYDVLTTGVSVYSNQAGAIDDVIKTLVNMNGQLQDGQTRQPMHSSRDSKVNTSLPFIR